jgi:U3 small nucleolar RNA-associated protein 12
MVSRILFFLLKTHHNQISANRTMRTILMPLRHHLRAALQRQKEIIGYNLAALSYIRNKSEAERTTEYYEEFGMDEEKVKAKIAEGKKRKRVVITA